MTPEKIIELMALQPHPEGGWYRETFRAEATIDARAAVTAIYYLLKAGERSHWHRVRDADEIWNWHAGAALQLSISVDGRDTTTHILGADLAGGEQPQAVVTQGVWQSAISLGAWSFVGCVVAPGFEFAGFEMAPPDWAPGDG